MHAAGRGGIVNRSTTVSAGPPAFGGGDVWASVHGNSGFAPYMNFRGSSSFRRWDVRNFSSTGIRVNASNGKVYLGQFSPGQIIELDPATNAVKKWSTGNSPYNLALDGSLVYATAVSGGGSPDQIMGQVGKLAQHPANSPRWRRRREQMTPSGAWMRGTNLVRVEVYDSSLTKRRTKGVKLTLPH